MQNDAKGFGMGSLYTGRCLCGRIAYTAEGKPSFPHLCSCRMCERWSGAPTVAWLEFPLSGFKWTGKGGKPSFYRSSEKSRRGFCPRCGSSLCILDDGYDKISVTIESLDDPAAVTPGKQHSYRESAPPWWSVAISRPAAKGIKKAHKAKAGPRV
jgi:hypothetical protein